MAIPPPPPPGPPPPPVPKLGGGGGPLGALGGGSNSGDSRNALLLSIQKGAKLKKTVTNDKSGPAIAGKVGGSSGNSSSSSSNGRPNGGPGGGGGMGSSGGGGGGQKLGGIFGGMSEMPKLKPVNRGAAGNQSSSSTLNRSPPRTNNNNSSHSSAGGDSGVSGSNSSSSLSSSNMNSSISSSNSIGNGGALDFNAELTQHLTLKKKKLQQQQQQQSSASPGNVTEANLRTNRGPPPQPPPPPKNPPAPPPINGVSANASTLFGNANGGAAPVKSQSPVVSRRTELIVKIVTVEPNGDTQSLFHPPPLGSSSSFTITDPPSPGVVTPDNSNPPSPRSPKPPILRPKPVLLPNQNPFNFSRKSADNSTVSPVDSHSQQQVQEEAQIVSGSVSEMKRLLSAAAATSACPIATPSSPRPAGSHGKPNLAPKPPGNGGTGGSLLSLSNVSTTPTSPLLSPGGGKTATVSRHHSMKTPR